MITYHTLCHRQEHEQTADDLKAQVHELTETKYVGDEMGDGVGMAVEMRMRGDGKNDGCDIRCGG